MKYTIHLWEFRRQARRQACCLVDATWALVGLDPLRDVLDYLGSRLDAALAELNWDVGTSGDAL